MRESCATAVRAVANGVPMVPKTIGCVPTLRQVACVLLVDGIVCAFWRACCVLGVRVVCLARVLCVRRACCVFGARVVCLACVLCV